MKIAKVAEGFGLAAERVDTTAGFEAAFDRALTRTDAPSLIEVMVKKS
jgi:benzoylformate decarboxylase